MVQPLLGGRTHRLLHWLCSIDHCLGQYSIIFFYLFLKKTPTTSLQACSSGNSSKSMAGKLKSLWELVLGGPSQSCKTGMFFSCLSLLCQPEISLLISPFFRCSNQKGGSLFSQPFLCFCASLSLRFRQGWRVNPKYFFVSHVVIPSFPKQLCSALYKWLAKA